MRTIVLLFYACLFSVAAFAASLEKDYQKIVSKFDVPIEVRNLSDVSKETYWDAFLNKNEAYIKHVTDMGKNKGLEKKAQRMLIEAPKFYPQYSSFVDRSSQAFCDSLLAELGAPADGPKFTIYVIYDEDVNAYNVLTDDGFAICLNSGLLAKPGLTRDMLLSIVAREYAHGALKHSERGFYAQAHQERNAAIAGGLILGFYAVAVAWDSANNPEANSYAADNYYAEKEYDRIKRNEADQNQLFAYRYSVDQQYEADMAAFRFMQFMGNGNAYIEALKFMGSDDELFDNCGDPYPSVSSRIAFLNYLQDHPELKNTQNDKLRKKRMKKLVVSYENPN